MGIESLYRRAFDVILRVVAINITIGAVLFFLGFRINSIALLAFAIDKMLDSFNNIVSIFAIKKASKIADADHQYGHGKFEVLARFVLSMILFISMFQIAYSAIRRLFNPTSTLKLNLFEASIMIASLLIIILTSIYMSRKGEETGIKTLTAESYNYLGDTLSMTSIIIGIWLSGYGLYIIDPILALFISAMILRLGWRIFRESIDVLTDRAVLEPKVIERIAKNHESVLEVDEIASRSDGVGVFIEFTLRLDPALSLDEAHRIAHEIEEEIKRKIGSDRVRRITIHIEPFDKK